MFIHYGEIYLKKDHVQILKKEPDYVKQRYHAVATALSSNNKIIREKAVHDLKISISQFQRILYRFQDESIPGLRYKNRRPIRSPNLTPAWLEYIVVNVSEETGFGSFYISQLVNISLENQGKTTRVSPRKVSRILVRRGVNESEKRAKKDWKRFEWGRPNQLVQADLTRFNGIPLLTTEDDCSRKRWAIRLVNQDDKTVVKGLKKLLKIRYDNLLTDNGMQFNRKNKVIREYCEEYINEKHIWSSIHHPQTMGKLSAFQKGLKRFLYHKLGLSRNVRDIDRYIDVYVHWYNNGKYNSAIDTYPEERYSGQRDMEWYNRLVKSLKLEKILTIK